MESEEEEFEIGFGMTKLILDEDKEEENEKERDIIYIEDEFLKPTKLLYEEDPQYFILPKKIEKNIPQEIKYIQYERQQPEEEYLFAGTKLDIDEEFENENENDDEFLFKPSELTTKKN